jgi:hypothetical protein
MPKHQCLPQTFISHTCFWSIGKGNVVLQMAHVRDRDKNGHKS